MSSKNREKQYNNLIESIGYTVMFCICLVCLIVLIALISTGHISETYDPKMVIVCISIPFGLGCIFTLYCIIGYCYGYYIVYDDKIFYRNIYTKKTIMFSDIKKIEIKEENFLTYRTEMLNICNAKNTIKIHINEKNKEKVLKFADLLNKYCVAENEI